MLKFSKNKKRLSRVFSNPLDEKSLKYCPKPSPNDFMKFTALNVDENKRDYVSVHLGKLEAFNSIPSMPYFYLRKNAPSFSQAAYSKLNTDEEKNNYISDNLTENQLDFIQKDMKELILNESRTSCRTFGSLDYKTSDIRGYNRIDALFYYEEFNSNPIVKLFDKCKVVVLVRDYRPNVDTDWKFLLMTKINLVDEYYSLKFKNRLSLKLDEVEAEFFRPQQQELLRLFQLYLADEMNQQNFIISLNSKSEQILSHYYQVLPTLGPSSSIYLTLEMAEIMNVLDLISASNIKSQQFGLIKKYLVKINSILTKWKE